MEWDIKMLGKMAPYAAIQYLRKRIGYDEFLREYATQHQMQKSDQMEWVRLVNGICNMAEELVLKELV